jgi:AcrR family transcriptional regulator
MGAKGMAATESMRDRIIEVSWRLFYEKGYDNTTVDEIIQECGISKGGFYHHFPAKDDLLSSLPDMFDAQYERALKEMPEGMGSYEQLIYLSRCLFRYIEEKIPVEILSLVYSTQVIKKGQKFLLNQNRFYFKTLSGILKEGQKNGEIIDDKSLAELTKFYAMQERAVLYDWCICEGSYPLSSYGMHMLEFFISTIKKSE